MIVVWKFLSLSGKKSLHEADINLNVGQVVNLFGTNVCTVETESSGTIHSTQLTKSSFEIMMESQLRWT